MTGSATFTGNDWSDMRDCSPPIRAGAGRQNTQPIAYHFRTRETGDCFEPTEVNVTRASVGGSGGAKLALEVPTQGVRRLTPIETERLQGFPDAWTAIDGEATPDSRRYAAMGDAVTVPVIEWIGRRLAVHGE